MLEENRSRKPNPFGDARPREVVLEEKGVDWRRIDQEFDLRKDKRLKENIPLTTLTNRLEHISVGLRHPDRNTMETQSTRNALFEHQKQNTSSLVPSFMELMQRDHSDRCNATLNNSCRNRHPCNSSIEQENEFIDFNSSSIPMFHAHKSVHHRPVVAARHLVPLALYDCSTGKYVGSYAQVCPNIEPLRAVQNIESKCKRKWHGEWPIGSPEEMQTNRRGGIPVNLCMDASNFGEKYNGFEECHLKSMEGGTRRHFEDGFIGAIDELQANGRRHVIADCSMGRNNGGWKYEDGKKCYIEEGRRNFNQVSMNPFVELNCSRDSYLYYNTERGLSARSAFQITEFDSKRARQAHRSVRMDGASSPSNCNKKQQHRRRGKQARK